MKLPKNSKLIENNYRDKDLRGHILSIVDHNISNVSLIKCNSNTIRSNHYHKTDSHFMYVLKGQIDYFFKDIDNDNIKYINVKEGQNIFTPPLEIHATYFKVTTEIIVSSVNPRDKITYENDTVRVDFINKNNLNFYLEKYS